jgi:hypothetical protein
VNKTGKRGAGPAAGRKPARSADDFAVRKTPTGLGLFANRAFTRGDFVIEYTGALLPNDLADSKGGRYLFRVNSRWTIDGTGRENMSRYINHSCKPNCVAYTSGLKIRIYARRAIAPGEELAYDYGKEYFDAYIRPRGCGCPGCAGGSAGVEASAGARGPGRRAERGEGAA